MTPADPGPGPDRRVIGLLRWYPRAWRERYGEEFLAMVEDSLDDRKPGWRLRLGVAWSGLRERGHQVVLSGLAWKRNLSGWGMFVMAGCLLGVSVDDAGRHPPAAGAWQAAAAMAALAALATATGAAIVAAGAVAWPPFARFLRAGGWPLIRRRVTGAAAASAAAAGALIWLVILPRAMTDGQPSWSTAYTVAFVLSTLLFAVATGLWTAAVRAARKHLDLAPRIRAAETLLGAVVFAGVMTMVPVEIVWFGVIRSSGFWLGNGLALLVANFFTASSTLRRARRRARRQRAAAARGR
jgi:hypothetical protein